MSTVSIGDNLVMSSEDSSCPDESELELGLGLSLSRRSGLKYQPLFTNQCARIFAAKDFPSIVSSRSATSLAASTSSSSSSSSSSPSSVTGLNAFAGTKRTADSVVANNGPSQVVGWPPVGAYRMNSFNNHAKSPATNVFNSVTEKCQSNYTVKSTDNGVNNRNVSAKAKKGHLKSSWFVKVNMDGLPIGRKVDLRAHNSYESLALTLEEMFDEHTDSVSSKTGSKGEELGRAERRQSTLLDGSSKFVLTYEDKDGDWMLVGDVPWGMFLSSVRRLRIMRTSETNGLALKPEEKNSRQRS